MKKKKIPMQEPVETIKICIQQSIESVGGLNPIQIEIDTLASNTLYRWYKVLLAKACPKQKKTYKKISKD